MVNILKYLTPKSKVAYIESDMTVRQGLEKFKANGYTAIPVLNTDGTYYGVVTEGDFLWTIVNNENSYVQQLENIKIKDMIRKKVPSCNIDTSMEEIIRFITNFNFVPIVDDRNILMGIITRKSIINYLSESRV